MAVLLQWLIGKRRMPSLLQSLRPQQQSSLVA
jgi:hypothetical protein